MHSPGRERFLEISCELFGEEAVRKHCRVAPVPSLFIDGELFLMAFPHVRTERGHRRGPEQEGAQAGRRVIMTSGIIHIEVLHEGAH